MTHEELMYASPEDIEFFNKCIEGLPKDPGYSCGPHSVRCLREIVNITEPSSIIEIGLNCGYSSALWLELAEEFSVSVLSIDISERKETLDAGFMLSSRYPSRFQFLICDSKKVNMLYAGKLERAKASLIFIDGGHEYEDVKSDIQLAINLGIKWIAFDDWLPQFGPGVQKAIAEHPELEMVKEMGNIVLMLNNDYHE